MKTKYLLGCVLAASLLSTSCSDFLQEDPKGKLTPKNFFDTKEKVDAGLFTLYEKVQQSQTYTNMLYPQWQGDDMTANPGSNKQAVAELDGFSSKSNNKGVRDAWQRNYAVIKAANLLITDAAEAPIAKNDLDVALGQAHYWRAWSYFYLVRLFGELPLITSPALQDDVPLSTVESVYELIVKDLKAAESMVAEKYTTAPQFTYGTDNYVTKNAVKATLSAVYMAMAGYPLNKGTEYYKMAAAKAKEVIDQESAYGYFLEENWNEVYSMGHNYTKATVLGIANSPQNGSWNHDSEFTSCCRFEGLGDGGWGDVWGEIKFWKNYPDGPRKRAVYAPKVTFENGSGEITKMVDWWEKDEQGNAVVAAYHPMFSVFTVNADEKGNEVKAPYDYTKRNYRGMTNGARHRVIRYSEVLLWYAESAARSGGDLTLAKQCLKRVHDRAVDDKSVFTYMDGTKKAIDAMSAEDVAKAALEEHGWEVAGYWVAMVTRRADEFRMNQLKVNFDYRVANKPLEVAPGFTATESVAVVNKTWNGDKTIYLPYPDSEVEKNPNLVRK